MIEEKKALLKILLSESLQKSILHNKKHIKHKNYDEILEFIIASLSATSIALLLSGFGSLLAIIFSSTGFILDRISSKLDFKSKSNIYKTTCKQYSDLSREIAAVLAKNHLTEDKYDEYIDEVNNKISLIQDSALEI